MDNSNNNNEGVVNSFIEAIRAIFKGKDNVGLQNDALEQRLAECYQNLIKQGLSEKKAERAIKQMRTMLQNDLNTPPKIAFIGMCGVGKSTTINALFNAGRQVNHSVPCTKKAEPSLVTTNKGILEVYDMPGLGEGEEEDEEYLREYKKVLPIVDVILFIITDRSQFSYLQYALRQILETRKNERRDLERRLMTASNQEERYQLQLQLQKITEIEAKERKKLLKKIVFAVNKVDLFNGKTETNTAEYDNQDWNTYTNLPSAAQKEHIEEFVTKTQERISRVAPDWRGNISTYSATKRYHLEQLLSEMIAHIDVKKVWRITELADIADFMELVSPEAREKMLQAQQNGKK